MIVKKETKGDIIIYYVKADITNDKMASILNNKLKRNQIDTIIDHDADVYTEDGILLLRFRKNKLNHKYIEEFYDNIINFALQKTNNRGCASGSTIKLNTHNPRIMTNILGYFDTLSPAHKVKFKKLGKPMPTLTVRETRFNQGYPEKFKKLLPLIKEIDHYYEKLIPEKYNQQRKKANQTPFKINGTSFTTITTNVNFQTAVHTDKGDDEDGFGNLTVIEKGKYTCGETCFPQYKIGVDVKLGDVLFMDVHQAHGNLPILLKTPDAKRLSIVCYLRKNIWKNTKGKTKKFMESHNKTLKTILGKK
jgi:hypothetical protein